MSYGTLADIQKKLRGLKGKKAPISKACQKRLEEIRKASAQLQKEFPGRWELQSDLYTVGPTDFILNKIRNARRPADQTFVTKKAQGNIDMIVSKMDPGRDYTRAQLGDIAGLTSTEVVRAVKEALAQGRIREIIRKVGDGTGTDFVKQGGRYVLPD